MAIQVGKALTKSIDYQVALVPGLEHVMLNFRVGSILLKTRYARARRPERSISTRRVLSTKASGEKKQHTLVRG